MVLRKRRHGNHRERMSRQHAGSVLTVRRAGCPVRCTEELEESRPVRGRPGDLFWADLPASGGMTRCRSSEKKCTERSRAKSRARLSCCGMKFTWGRLWMTEIGRSKGRRGLPDRSGLHPHRRGSFLPRIVERAMPSLGLLPAPKSGVLPMPGDRFYQSAAWRRFRAAVLRAHPICEVPGCGIAATHVDHIVPRRCGGADLETANVQAMCASCHSAKTAIRDGGFGRPGRPAVRIRLAGCDATGMPRDPAHAWRTRPT